MKRLHLSTRDRKIFGVCGGIAENLEIDPNLVRILAIPLLFFTGVLPLVVTYVAAWVLLPEDPAASPFAASDRTVDLSGTVGDAERSAA